MALDVLCPGCGLDGRFPDGLAGQSIICPRCSTAVQLPAATEMVSPVVTTIGPVPAGSDPFTVWVGDPLPGPVHHPGPAGPEDAAGHLVWLREETKRFNYHVAQQLETIQVKRKRLLELEEQVESKCIAREQEMNRLQTTLTARAEAVQRREDEAARRETELAPREADVQSREANLARLQAESIELERRVPELRTTMAELEERRDRANEDYQSLAGHRAALEVREAALERGERALQQQLAEIDDLEDRLRKELEEQERDLERQRHLLEERLREARVAPVAEAPAEPARDWPPGS